MNRIALLIPIVLILSACASLPVDPSSLRREADAIYHAGDFRAAATAYEQLTAEQGASAEDWFRLGNAYVELDRLVDAASAFRAAMALDPKHGEAGHNLGLVYLQLGVTTLLAARRGLPDVDPAAAATMRYLACIMEIFMGQPDPVTCRDEASAE